MNSVNRTGLWTAAARAHEAQRADRLFLDPYAERLAGAEGEALLTEGLQTGSEMTVFAIRTRFFDDLLLETVIRPGQQVVLLGAGMDTRAYRMAWPTDTVIYEVDQGTVLAYKQARLSDVVLSVDRRPVDADLMEDIRDPLLRMGFDRQTETVWIAEGFLAYLPASPVRRLIEVVTELSVAPSWFGADFMTTAFATSPYTTEWMQHMNDMGAPLQFLTDDPEVMLSECGWASRVVQVGENGANFGRWSYPVAPRSVPSQWPTALLVRAHRP